ncbi:cyclic nucleotide-binding domain-containing protein [Salinisphaera sp.]|uniref:Crp/Fnr family transcriptional regulator n=1 Tax=Salinisphaera sp. TaxID=1914330 RepID=UPI002D7988C8|nr:cyclic nucleotide-binding domain-containing protein [Salinisphaera sp.]HET7314281.1 cyclic nucleotide-binding domain-containing protein [Salinisphaera sp.]
MSNQPTVSDLAERDFFIGLDPSFLSFLAGCATPLALDTEDILFRHDHRAQQFYFIRRGAISIEVAAISGPALEMQHLGPGEVVGWSWLIPPYRWHFQARALEDSDVLVFDGDAILARCESDPKFGYELFKRFSALMSRRLSSARQKMMEEWHPAGFA